jgi:hypothetical protein
MLDGFKSKQGKDFSAKLVLDDKKIKFEFKWLTCLYMWYII